MDDFANSTNNEISKAFDSVFPNTVSPPIFTKGRLLLGDTWYSMRDSASNDKKYIFNVLAFQMNHLITN